MSNETNEVVEKKSRKKPRVTAQDIIEKLQNLEAEAAELEAALVQIPTDNILYALAEKVFTEKKAELEKAKEAVYIQQK